MKPLILLLENYKCCKLIILIFDHIGWWLIDIQGMIGWAPASFLVPVDKDDIENEFEENDALIGTEKGNIQHLSIV